MRDCAEQIGSQFLLIRLSKFFLPFLYCQSLTMQPGGDGSCYNRDREHPNKGNRITCQYTGIHSGAQTFFNTRNIFLRNVTADNRIIKFKTGITFHRFKFNFNLSELTGTTGLFLVSVFNIARFRNGFTISYLRITNICINLKFTTQTINNNIQVQFAHTFNNGLP